MIRIINYQINSLRENLYFLISIHKLTDEPVVKCSQKLDELIVKYQKHCFSTNWINRVEANN